MIDAECLQQRYGVIGTLDTVIDEQDVRAGRKFEQLIDLMVVDGTPRNYIGQAILQMCMGLLIGKAARKDGEIRLDPLGQIALCIIVADVDAISQQSV